MPTLKDVSKYATLAKVAYNKVYAMLEDDAKISDYAMKAEGLLKKIPAGKGDDLADLVETGRICVLMLRDFLYKEYTDISKKNLALIAFGALYTVSPIDLIPDTLGLIGFIDDAAILNFVRKSVSGELDKYKEWRKTTGKDAPLVED